jgi:site-specific DNA recombinase
MKVDGYTRVSRVGGREGETFISPTLQRESIAAWAHANKYELAAIHEDLDQPGSTLERPGLKRALQRLEAGDTTGIVCARLDRFGRSVQDSANLLARIRDAGGTLFTVAEGINTSGYMGKFLADIFAALGELELNRIRENWNSARAAAVARGVHVSGRVPFGYRRCQDGRLEPDPRTAPLVPDLFRRRVGGESWARLAGSLNEQDVPTPWGGGGWSIGTVRTVIRNRVYLGEARAGSTIANTSAHEALIDLATFEAANRTKGVAPGRSGRASGLLSGILRCAGCRYAMKASQGQTRHGKPFLEYRCKSSRSETAGGRCPAPAAVKATVIEPYVLGEFFRFIGEYRAAGFEPDAAIELAESELAAAEAELEAALDTRLADALGTDSEAYLRLLRQRRDAVEEARTQLADVRRSTEVVRQDAVELSALWPDLTLYEQRKLLASTFDCVFVRRTRSGGGTVDVATRTWICWHGEAPTLPVRGRRWTVQPFEFPRVGAEVISKHS